MNLRFYIPGQDSDLVFDPSLPIFYEGSSFFINEYIESWAKSDLENNWFSNLNCESVSCLRSHDTIRGHREPVLLLREGYRGSIDELVLQTRLTDGVLILHESYWSQNVLNYYSISLENRRRDWWSLKIWKTYQGETWLESETDYDSSSLSISMGADVEEARSERILNRVRERPNRIMESHQEIRRNPWNDINFHIRENPSTTLTLEEEFFSREKGV